MHSGLCSLEGMDPQLHIILLDISPTDVGNDTYGWCIGGGPGGGCRSMEILLYLTCKIGWDLQIEDKRATGHGSFSWPLIRLTRSGGR